MVVEFVDTIQEVYSEVTGGGGGSGGGGITSGMVDIVAASFNIVATAIATTIIILTATAAATTTVVTVASVVTTTVTATDVFGIADDFVTAIGVAAVDVVALWFGLIRRLDFFFRIALVRIVNLVLVSIHV